MPVAIVPVPGSTPSSLAPVLGLSPYYPWLGQVLFGDQGATGTGAGDGIYRLIDLNGDGDTLDAGEHSSFFDEGNASGLGDVDNNIFDMVQARDGTVYAGDGDTDSVYRLRDLDGDGDANDAGEANVWFSGAGNAAGFTLPTPNGIAEGPDGSIYVVNAGTGPLPTDAVYRTFDLNGDGDANDEGEAVVWVNLQTLNPTSSAFDISFVDGVAYVTDTNGAAPDTVYRLEDANRNGVIDAGEASVFISDTTSYGAPVDIANTGQGDSLLTFTWIGNAGDPPRVYRLTDLDGSKAIDDASEAVEVWNWTALAPEFKASTMSGFSITANRTGDVFITFNATGARHVVRLTDLNADGDYMDAGETLLALSNTFDSTTANRPRAVATYDDGTLLSHPAVFREAWSPVKFAAGLTVADGDSAVVSGAVVRIAGNFSQGDVLDFDRPTGSPIHGHFDAATGVLTLAGAASVADYQAVLRTLSFESRSSDPDTDMRSITITLYDERGLDGASAEVATTVAVETSPESTPIFGSDLGDLIRGGDGRDAIAGLGGNDVVRAGKGADRVSGGDGGDLLSGGRGHDALAGDDGRDRILGGDGDDTLSGGAAGDRLQGGAGSDVLAGDAGRDRLAGGTGADKLDGGLGDDRLSGGAGDDTLTGGAGRDVLHGGAGADAFVFTAASNTDIVLDFDVAEDTIVFDGVTYEGNAVTSLAEAAVAATSDGHGGTKFVFDDGAVLVLRDFLLAV